MTNQYLTDFSKLELKAFFSAGFGLVFHAPPTWVEGEDPDVFQLKDPATGTEIAASAYQNPGLGLEQWARLRGEAVSQTMPFLQLQKKPHVQKGVGWRAIASEYEGVFPGGTEPRHYWLLCWRTDAKVTSLSLTTDKPVFVANRALYRWLIQNKLELSCPLSGSATGVIFQPRLLRDLRHLKASIAHGRDFFNIISPAF